MNRAEEGQGSSSSQKRNDSQEIRKEYLAMKDAPCCKEKCLENISFYDLLQLRMNMDSKSRVNRRQFVLDYLTVNPSLTFTYLVLTFAAHHGSLLMGYPVMFIENATVISSRNKGGCEANHWCQSSFRCPSTLSGVVPIVCQKMW